MLLTKPALRICLFGMVLGLLFAGLYPFNFVQKNQVAWFPAGAGIEFQGYGQAYGSSTIELNHALESDDQVSLEFIVSSLEGAKPSIEKLFSVYGSNGESFALERWTEYLAIAGWFRNRQGQTTFQRLFCGPVFATRARRFISVTSSPDGTTVYLEGIRQTYYPGLSLALRNFKGTVLLGQTPDGHQAWHGIIAGLALYPTALAPNDITEGTAHWRQDNALHQRDRAATALLFYTFDEGQGTTVRNHGSVSSDLLLPKRLHALTLKALNVPTRRDFTDWSDIALNILGFVPLGVLLVISPRITGSRDSEKIVLRAVFFGFAISLTIELLQVFLPSRDSSLLDLIMNTLGSWIGARLGLMLFSLFQHTIRLPL